MSILDDIIAYKRDEVRVAKTSTPPSTLKDLIQSTAPTRGFASALAHRAHDGFALIAEIKKASPSKGLIREDFDPIALAKAYEAGGAACLSVLTDRPSFQGDPVFLRQVRSTVSLPLLRKDFMIDPYQVLEARAWGADCILLIMACLDPVLANDLEEAAIEQNLDVLVECHDENDLEKALNLKTQLLGINNRNLNTFETTLTTTYRLAAQLPSDRFLISESGIHTHSDLVNLNVNGAKAFLVGESLMRQTDVKAATHSLLNGDSCTISTC